MIGLIGQKIGMTQVFDDEGVLIPVTVIKIENNAVVGEKTQERDGYSAVVLGTVDLKASRATKPYLGQFRDGMAPKRHVIEFRDFDKECKTGDSLGVEIMDGIRFVDVVGTGKGKGFAGVMKRYNFGGGRETHGSKFHREPGSTGQSTTPANTKKGRKMPGRMGGDRVTVQNLKVVRLDAEAGLLLVKGAIPGPKKSMVVVRNAKKRG
ncbi:50S ribosomal protein L3 [Entomospira entomophila]|uniref:Large ribosomal subunit protein uL3 n=1 Tax=Entomospira entomophila TaxID=2719988 RepID=A0A968GC61_9SPIO|nr:50S ribosomal protein L3 [Entomospira entomophilus]NIZ40254.1 50S ribosomal protein L3 [Entomospira entomophilus]WDI35813.1 50S ribosomal protein L3 [Entomospira entomophilus]